MNRTWPPADLVDRSEYVRALCKEITLRESAVCPVCGTTFSPHPQQVRFRRRGILISCRNAACKSEASRRRRRAKYRERLFSNEPESRWGADE